jgi:hypothetical protein
MRFDQANSDIFTFKDQTNSSIHGLAAASIEKRASARFVYAALLELLSATTGAWGIPADSLRVLKCYGWIQFRLTGTWRFLLELFEGEPHQTCGIVLQLFDPSAVFLAFSPLGSFPFVVLRKPFSHDGTVFHQTVPKSSALGIKGSAKK